MLGSLFRPVRVGRLFDIPILVMPAVLVLTVAVLASATDGRRLAELGLLLLFLSSALLIHELAHAVVARRQGLRVLDITIWPLGGMARMEGLLDRPQAEAPVAVAGPLANLLLAVPCLLLPGPIAAAAGWINLILGLGNLVPAFPLDGGRILRAWLARRSPLSDATAAAVRIGSWTGVILVLGAIWQDSFWIGLLLLVYIWFTGKLELVQVILRTSRPPTLRTGEVFRRALRRAAPDQEVHRPRPDAAAPGEPGARLDDLENFRGDLDEFFRRRR